MQGLDVKLPVLHHLSHQLEVGKHSLLQGSVRPHHTPAVENAGEIRPDRNDKLCVAILAALFYNYNVTRQRHEQHACFKSDRFHIHLVSCLRVMVSTFSVFSSLTEFVVSGWQAYNDVRIFCCSGWSCLSCCW